MVKERKIESKEFFIFCPKCRKEIRGSSPASVENNLKVHISTQHPKKTVQNKPQAQKQRIKKGDKR